MSDAAYLAVVCGVAFLALWYALWRVLMFVTKPRPKPAEPHLDVTWEKPRRRPWGRR